jgi:hypothetical protein
LEISHTFLARRKNFKKVAAFPPFFSCKDYLVTEARVKITREKKQNFFFYRLPIAHAALIHEHVVKQQKMETD